jgi:hypothetical protein
MAAQLMILPTGEVVRANRRRFSELLAAGLPLMVMTHFLLDTIMMGEVEGLTERELMDGWRGFLYDSQFMNERLEPLVEDPGFSSALYALYQSMHCLQELLLTVPRGSGFLSGVVQQGWNGDDMVIAREISSIGGRGHG